MKKSAFYTLLVAVLIIILLTIVGNIIVIGDKLWNLTPFIGGVYIVVIVFVVVRFVLLPIKHTFSMPEYKGLKSSKKDLTWKLMDSGTEDNIPKWEVEANDIVKKTAIKMFVFTSMSQNGIFDIVTSISLNIQMINKLVEKAGFRPTSGQLLKLYGSIVSASLVISAFDDMLDEIDLSDIAAGIGLKIVGGTILKSGTNGMMNAYVALRVGYATIEYLNNGSSIFDAKKEKIRGLVRLQARRNIMAVVKEGIAEGFKKGLKGIEKLKEINDSI